MLTPRTLRVLLYRLLVLAVLAASLIVLPAVGSSPQSDCCTTCLERFFQCDANTLVCCKLYTSCVQQCQGGCPACPDQ